MVLLNSLAASLEVIQSEMGQIFLIENGAHRADLEVLRPILIKSKHDLIIVQGQGNIGYGAAHNIAINKVTSRYHLVLNPDVVLDKNNIYEAIKFMENHHEAVMLAPTATYFDGTKQFISKNYPSIVDLFLRGFGGKLARKVFDRRLARYELRNEIEREMNIRVPLASGCYMFCRSETLVGIGGFDENFFLYFEDYDLSQRMWEEGNIYHVPSVKIKHSGGHSSRKGNAHISMFMKSAWLFFGKHGWKWW